MQLVLRSFMASDLPTILEIERSAFPSPWKEGCFLREMSTPYSRVLVAEREGLVVGYLCRWFVADEVQILNVAVHHTHRRCGVGKALLLEVLTEARQGGARSVSLEVRKSNLPALILYERLKFRQVAIRRRYYEDGEDALLMVCCFPEGVV